MSAKRAFQNRKESKLAKTTTLQMLSKANYPKKSLNMSKWLAKTRKLKLIAPYSNQNTS